MQLWYVLSSNLNQRWASELPKSRAAAMLCQAQLMHHRVALRMVPYKSGTPCGTAPATCAATQLHRAARRARDKTNRQTPPVSQGFLLV